jgi:hypothetical protein
VSPSSTPVSIRIERPELEMVEPPGRGQEFVRRVLGVEPRLHRPAVDPQLLLLLRQSLAARHPQLPFDQVLAANLLGHRMLDLEPRVHLHEPDAVGAKAFGRIGDELDRARADIVDRLGRLDRRLADRGSGRLVHSGRRRFLDHLLVAALERAVALEQVDDIAVAVAEHLDLDMARPLDIFLDQHPVVAERRSGLPLAALAACRRSRPRR